MRRFHEAVKGDLESRIAPAQGLGVAGAFGDLGGLLRDVSAGREHERQLRSVTPLDGELVAAADDGEVAFHQGALGVSEAEGAGVEEDHADVVGHRCSPRLPTFRGER